MKGRTKTCLKRVTAFICAVLILFGVLPVQSLDGIFKPGNVAKAIVADPNVEVDEPQVIGDYTYTYTWNYNNGKCTRVVTKTADAAEVSSQTVNYTSGSGEEIGKLTASFKSEDVKIAKTNNLNELGEFNNQQYSNYATEWSTVSIPGAKSLDVNLKYATEADYDWVAVFKGDQSDESIENQQLSTMQGSFKEYFGDSFFDVYDGNSTNTPIETSFTIGGTDAVSFLFTSDINNNFYGYYATITETPDVVTKQLNTFTLNFDESVEEEFIVDVTADGESVNTYKFLEGTYVEVIADAELDFYNSIWKKLSKVAAADFDVSQSNNRYTYSFFMVDDVNISHEHDLSVEPGPKETSNLFSAGCDAEYIAGAMKPLYYIEAEDIVYDGDPVIATLYQDDTEYTVVNPYPEEDFSILDVSEVTYRDAEHNVMNEAPVNAGTYTASVVITYSLMGRSDFRTISDTFTIAPKDISDSSEVSVVIDPVEKPYDLTAPSFNVSASYGDISLVKDTDFTYSVTPDGEDVREYTVTVTGKGNYTGKVVLTYNINAANVSDFIKFNPEDKTYDGQPYVPTAPTAIAGTQGEDMLDGANINYEYVKLPTITFESNPVYSSEAPVNAGRYLARVTIKKANYVDVVLSSEFEIRKAELVIENKSSVVDNGRVNTLGVDTSDPTEAKNEALNSAAEKLVENITGFADGDENELLLQEVYSRLTIADPSWSSAKGYNHNDLTLADNTERYFLDAGAYSLALTDNELDNYTIRISDPDKKLRVLDLFSISNLDLVFAREIPDSGSAKAWKYYADELNDCIYNGATQYCYIWVAGNYLVNSEDSNNPNDYFYPYIKPSEYKVNVNDTTVLDNTVGADNIPRYKAEMQNAGGYEITVTPTESNKNLANQTYASLNNRYTITVNPLKLSDAYEQEELEYTPKEKAYNGTEQSFELETIKFKDKTLVLDTDYSIDAENSDSGTNVGVYNYSFTGKGNFTGSLTGTWKIVPASAQAAMQGISIRDLNKTFDGEVVNVNSKEDLVAEENNALAALIKEGAESVTTVYAKVDESYNSENGEGINDNQWSADDHPVTVGKYVAKTSVSGSNFTEFVIYETFTISKKDVTLTMDYNSSIYTVRTNDTLCGAVHSSGTVPAFQFSKTGLVVIVDSENKTITSDYFDVGNYKYAIDPTVAETGNNANYNFTFADDSLEIIPLSLTVNASNIISTVENDTSLIYNDALQSPDFALYSSKLSGNLVKDIDFELSGDTEKKDAGGYTLTISGKGNYTGSRTLDWEITKYEIKAEDIELSSDEVVYDGSDLQPGVTVKVDLDGDKVRETTLTIGTDYTVICKKDNKEVSEIVDAGIYTINIAGAVNGNYTAQNPCYKEFEVKKASQRIEALIIDQVKVYDGNAICNADFRVSSDCVDSNEADVLKTVSFKYYSDDEAQNEIAPPVDAGTYYYKVFVDETDNYLEAEGDLTIFEIDRRRVKITPAEDYSITYGTIGVPELDYDVEFASQSEGDTGYLGDEEQAKMLFGTDILSVGKELVTTNIQHPADNDSFDVTIPTNDAGTYDYVIAPGKNETDNYELYLDKNSNDVFTVEKKTLSKDMFKVVIDNNESLGNSVVFDSKTHRATVTFTDKTDNTVISDADDVEEINATKKAQQVGGYDFDFEASEDGNYTGEITITWSITSKDETAVISGIENTYVYGNAINTDDLSVVNEENGDTYTNVEYKFYKRVATEEGYGEPIVLDDVPKDVGEYSVDAIVTKNGTNVDVQSVDFVINPRELKIKLSDDNVYEKVYGDDDPVFAYVADGDLAYDDTLEDVISGTLVRQWHGIDEDAGDYFSLFVWDEAPAVDLNYTLDLDAIYEHDFKINKRQIESSDLVIKNKKCAYTGSYVSVEFEVVVNGETLEEDVDYEVLGTTKKKAIGTYEFSVSALEDSNYYTDDLNDPVVGEWSIVNCIFGHTLTLGESIGVNFYVDFAAFPEFTDAYVIFNTNTLTDEKIDISESSKQGNYNVFTCYVAPAELTEDIAFDIYVDDELVASEVYQARDYCIAQIESNAVTDKQKKRVQACKALLLYGGAAQTFFNHKTDDMADSYLIDNNITYSSSQSIIDFETMLTDPYTEYISPERKVEINQILVENGVEDIEYYGTAINVQTSTKIRHYFVVKNGTVNEAINKYKSQLKFSGSKVKATFSTVSSTMFVMESEGILAVQLNDSEKYGISLGNIPVIENYSVYTYARGQYENNSLRYVDLVEAMYYYSEECKLYFS